MRAITKQIDVILDTDELLNAMGKSKIENARIRRLDLAIAQKSSELERYRNFRMKLYEALNDNLINRDEYEKMRSRYTGMIEETENVIRQLSAEREESLTNTAPRDWMTSVAKFKGQMCIRDSINTSTNSPTIVVTALPVIEPKAARRAFAIASLRSSVFFSSCR